ncbi:hypothetical protein BDV39DRAFT_198877 [Aspergillus sergii]|uniref:CmcJ-like methyltransferase n=1 Tax=Aspergillus sergii TaxID=1034303 RepID=A0A5N6XQS7_9EURO|nr:hypothetical protein BDV39DRAFT_198877 [Aspergillus sergii]
MSVHTATQHPGSLCYMVRDEIHKTEKPYFVYFPVDEFPGAKQTNVKFDYHDVGPSDIRGKTEDFKLDECGFEVVEFHSRFKYKDFNEFSKIENDYYKEVSDFLQDRMGAAFVQIFDCVIRRRNDQFPEKQFQNSDVQPVRAVHIDSSRERKMRRCKRALEDAGIRGGGRLQILNVWKPLRGPVRDWPLAVCDYRSCDDSDLTLVDQVYPNHYDEGTSLYFNSKHQWYFLSDQQPHEAFLMKMMDSDCQAADYCAHAAFPWKEAVKVEDMRESIEVRCVVFIKGDGK